MLSEKNFFMKCVHAKTGGGGWHCYCCTPRKRDNKRTYRSYKRSAKVEYNKLFLDQLKDI